jgi:ankyrin repeat protein
MIGDVELLAFLVEEFNADMEVRDDTGQMLLHKAASYGQVECLWLVVEKYHANLEAIDHHGATPLHLAAFKGQANAARALVELGADMKAMPRTGQLRNMTPLRLSQKHNHPEVAEVLKELESATKERAKAEAQPTREAIDEAERMAVLLMKEEELVQKGDKGKGKEKAPPPSGTKKKVRGRRVRLDSRGEAKRGWAARRG